MCYKCIAHMYVLPYTSSVIFLKTIISKYITLHLSLQNVQVRTLQSRFDFLLFIQFFWHVHYIALGAGNWVLGTC